MTEVLAIDVLLKACEGKVEPELIRLAMAQYARMSLCIKHTKEMRLHQYNYFMKGRKLGDLKLSKQWEREVDKDLLSVYGKTLPAEVPQERLL